MVYIRRVDRLGTDKENIIVMRIQDNERQSIFVGAIAFIMLAIGILFTFSKSNAEPEWLVADQLA